MWIRTSTETMVDTETGNNIVNDKRDGGKVLLLNAKGKAIELLYLRTANDSTDIFDNIYRQIRQNLSDTDGGLDQFEVVI